MSRINHTPPPARSDISTHSPTPIAAGKVPFIYYKVVLVSILPALAAFLFLRLLVRTIFWLIATDKATRAWAVRFTIKARALTAHLTLPTLIILLACISVRLLFTAGAALYNRQSRGRKAARMATYTIRQTLRILWAFGLWGPLAQPSKKCKSSQPLVADGQ